MCCWFILVSSDRIKAPALKVEWKQHRLLHCKETSLQMRSLSGFIIKKKAKNAESFQLQESCDAFPLSSLFLISATSRNLDCIYTDKHEAFWSFSACLCCYETAFFWESRFKEKLCSVPLFFFFFLREKECLKSLGGQIRKHSLEPASSGA